MKDEIAAGNETFDLFQTEAFEQGSQFAHGYIAATDVDRSKERDVSLHDIRYAFSLIRAPIRMKIAPSAGVTAYIQTGI